MSELADALQDHAIVFIAKPETGSPQAIQLRSNCRNEAPFFGEAVDTGRPNHIQTPADRPLNSIAIVHWQGFRVKFLSQSKSFTFSSMQGTLTKRYSFGSISQVPDSNPLALGCENQSGGWETNSVDNNFFKHG